MNPQDTDSATQDWIERSGMAETVVAAITALAYLATLSFGFVYDDVPQILKNPAVQAWWFVPQYFTSHVWAAIYPHTGGNYYRPVFLLWLRLNYAVFGTNAVGWHLTSVACHVVATWLVFRVTRQLTGQRATAFAAALIFGLHPAHIENVAWISGVTDPLMACFVLGSLSLFLSYRSGGEIWLAGGALLLFALGLFAKETAIITPVFMLACAAMAGPEELASPDGAQPSGARRSIFPRSLLRQPGSPRGMRSAAVLSAAMAVILIYLAARFFALQGLSHATISIGWRQVILTWPSVLWFYVKHLVSPGRLSEFYPLNYVSEFSARAVLLPLGFLLLAGIATAGLVFAIRERLAKRLAGLALVLIVVPLLPVLELRSLTAGDIVHDRYLYLPSVGYALFTALLVGELARRLRPSGAQAPGQIAPYHDTSKVVPFPVSPREGISGNAAARAAQFSAQPDSGQRAFWFAIVTGIVAAFAVLTISQEMQWASDILLYTRGVESAPGNLTVRDNLANALLDAKQPERAIRLYLEVLSRNPAFWRSNYNLGFAYYRTRNFAGAEDYLTRAIRIDPSDSDQYIYLALAELELKKFSEAGENARRALSRNPQARGYHFVAGVIYERENEWERAADEFKAEIGGHPDNAAALAELRKVASAYPTAGP